MITYLYGFISLLICIGALYILGFKLGQWIPALMVTSLFAVTLTSTYYFYLEQIMVKRWGGTMSLSVPKGQRHLSATWKADNLWIENYDPATNTCIFQEYSRGNMLEGKVQIKNCNPLATGL